jgi:hypothetical protein
MFRQSRVLPPALTPLVGERRWVTWRWQQRPNGKTTKVPFRPDRSGVHARTDDPASWGSHEDAVQIASAGHADGIGYVLTGSEIAALDLDDCRDPETGRITPWAQALIAEAQSYTEITVSGTGLRIIGIGRGAPVHRNQAVPSATGRIETYRRATRYIVVTGDVLPSSPDVLAPLDELIDSTVAHLDGATRIPAPSATGSGSSQGDARIATAFAQPGLPADLMRLVQHGVPQGKRSEQFHRTVCWLKDHGWLADEIEALLSHHPNGIAAKYAGRLRAEVERSFLKGVARQSG